MRIITLFLILAANCLYANTDSLKAIQSLNELVINIVEENNNGIDVELKKWLKLFKQEDDLNLWLHWNINIGKAWQKIGRQDKALEYLEGGIDEVWRVGRTGKELELYAYALLRISNIYSRDLNAKELAATYMERYRSTCTDLLKKTESYLARFAYNKMGNIYSALRNEAKATYYFELTKRIRKKELNWKYYVLACRNLGDTYKELGKYPLAQKAYNEGLKWKDSLAIKDQIKLYSTVGLFNYHINNFSKLREFTDQAKALFDENLKEFTKKEHAGNLYDFYFNYGRINKGEKRYQEAESFYNKALHLLETDLKGGNRRQQAIMQINFGHLYFDQLQLDKAEKHFQGAIPYLSSILSEYNNPHLIPVNELIGEELLSYVYEMLGKVGMAKCKKDQNPNNLRNAIRYFELADLVDQIRLESYATEKSSLTALNSQRELKEEIQSALFELWQRDQQDSTLEKMYTFSEKSRSLLLLKKSKTEKAASVWNKETQRNYYLNNAKLQQLEEEIYSFQTADFSNNADTINALRGQFLTLNDELAELQKIKNKTSKFTFSKPSSVKSIQQTLAKDQALLEFFIGEDYIFTYAITKQDLKVYKKNKPKDFFQTVDSLRSNLIAFSEATQTFGENAFSLYDVLLQDALKELPKKVNRLVMVKDHILNFSLSHYQTNYYFEHCH